LDMKYSQSVFHVQNQEYVGELFLFIPIYSILFQGVFGKSQGVLGHEIQSGNTDWIYYKRLEEIRSYSLNSSEFHFYATISLRISSKILPWIPVWIKAILWEYIRDNFIFIPIYSSLFQRIFVKNRRQLWHELDCTDSSRLLADSFLNYLIGYF